MSKRKIIEDVIIAAFGIAVAAVLIFILVTLVFCLVIREKKESTLLWYTEIGETTYINFTETYVYLDYDPFIEGNCPKSSESYSLLKSFVNLEVLYTNSKIPVSDISFLEHTRKMKHLSVYSGSYADLSPVSGLKRLETLVISVENVDDLSPLYALENAEKIYLLNAGGFDTDDFEELSRKLPNCEIRAFGSVGTRENTPIYSNN